MPKLLRTLLLWLLALALPLQGLAAPLMLNCASSAVHAGHHGHEIHGLHASGHGSDAHDVAPDLDATGGSAEHRCSACAACCAAMALPIAPQQPAPPGPEPLLRPASTAAVAPYLTDGLERPPRAPLD